MVCVIAAAVLPAADVPERGGFPTIIGILRKPSGRATSRTGPLPSCRRTAKGHKKRHTICSLMRRGVRLYSVEVSMNVLNRRWLFRVGVGLLGAFLAIQLVPYGRDHINPPLPWTKVAPC